MSPEKKAPPPEAEPLRIKHVERPHGRPKSYHLAIGHNPARPDEYYATCKRCTAIASFVDGVALIVHKDRCDALGQAA